MGRIRHVQPIALPALPLVLSVLLAVLVGCHRKPLSRGRAADAQDGPPAPASRFFATAAEEAYSTVQVPGDGDLWPSCWADDDNLYTANGDGIAFHPRHKHPDINKQRYDMAVSVITGAPPSSLAGRTLATNVGTNWSGSHYNRKPTGMLCIHGVLYLAYQNLSKTFDDVPAASIARSADHGRHWTWNRASPMFGAAAGQPTGPRAGLFTTLFFLDYGRDSEHSRDSYVYVYGLDRNWRAQSDLYLARVPGPRVMDRSAWQFYSGISADGQPQWSSEILQKHPVLTDSRLLYAHRIGGAVSGCPVIGQGGVVYDAPLRRYLFASWSCATHELYEAPEPWGPWRSVLSTDFGLDKTVHNYGLYGTSIPSKFISADGRTLYLQSNVWWDSYTFALRRVYLAPYGATAPQAGSPGDNLALAPGTRAISKSTHYGQLCALNCADGMATGMESEDDDDGEAKPFSWWGYTWPSAYRLRTIVYRTGKVTSAGGWFARPPRVQVRQNLQWKDVPGTTITPAYPASPSAGTHVEYTFHLPDGAWGDGVRILGTPGGARHFTSISRLSVYAAGAGS